MKRPFLAIFSSYLYVGRTYTSLFGARSNSEDSSQGLFTFSIQNDTVKTSFKTSFSLPYRVENSEENNKDILSRKEVTQKCFFYIKEIRS